MMPSRHAAISFGLGLVLWWVTSSFSSFVLTMIAGFLIDVDHFVEYFRFVLRGKQDKIFILLHSVELLVPGWILAFSFKWQTQAVVMTIGFLAHLASDYVYYRPRLSTYSLLYRALRGFDPECLARKRGADFSWTGRGPRTWW